MSNFYGSYPQQFGSVYGQQQFGRVTQPADQTQQPMHWPQVQSMHPMMQPAMPQQAPQQQSRNVAMFGDAPVGASIAGNVRQDGDLNGKVRRPAIPVSLFVRVLAEQRGDTNPPTPHPPRAGDHDLWLQGRANQCRRPEHRPVRPAHKRWPWR